ncbi:hypothetical protein T265_05971 [Opisthorchis viverrini]|uniref:Uncharacterized protein n=1 Tax=Opisthorchis viverrini TaxID=6198 RepID=A0A074ZIL4_OPIVI|nr:hypothetical protein T265_05971 [Opisthorchis viverrini]KER26836.1 hypothetical protein T265_05971 [Opisthorchis viverrini]
MNTEQRHSEKRRVTSNKALSISDKPVFHNESFYATVLANGTNVKVHCTTVVKRRLKVPTNEEAGTGLNEPSNPSHQAVLGNVSAKSIPCLPLNVENSLLENVMECELTQPMIITNKLTNAPRNDEPENKLESLSSSAFKPSIPLSNETRSVSADSNQSSTSFQKIAKHKSSRLIIGSTAVLSPEHDRSLGGVASEKSVEMRRVSLEWSPRVSVNTPKRRVSEHEVSWVDSHEIHDSDKSSDSDSWNEVDSRPSIVVNMDTTTGRKRSFALDRLDVDIKQYLEETLEEMDLGTQMSGASKE